MYVYIYTHTQWKIIQPQKEGNLAICSNMDELEGIMLGETSQTEKDKYCMISLICQA